MIAVSPTRYLDLRAPTWAALEQQGAIRFEEGIVLIRVEGAVSDMLRTQAPEMTLAEVQVARQAWQRR